MISIAVLLLLNLVFHFAGLTTDALNKQIKVWNRSVKAKEIVVEREERFQEFMNKMKKGDLVVLNDRTIKKLREKANIKKINRLLLKNDNIKKTVQDWEKKNKAAEKFGLVMDEHFAKPVEEAKRR